MLVIGGIIIGDKCPLSFEVSRVIVTRPLTILHDIPLTSSGIVVKCHRLRFWSLVASRILDDVLADVEPQLPEICVESRESKQTLLA